MKKKASFLISGITTVALLATAVGSFAAWDTLTDKAENFTVGTSTPVVLSISETKNDSTNTKLIPNSATIEGSNESKDPVKVGSFKASLNGSNTTDKKVKTNWTAEVTDNTGTALTGDAANYFTVTLVPVTDGTEGTAFDTTKTLELTDAGATYNVKVQFTGDPSEEAVKSYTAQSLKVKVTLTASADNTAS